jgi:NAD(P)-dependent dehydrogenase (short-subunit alcohol dehydrogenase family)
MKNNVDGKVWFITGAGRGLGLDIAKAALAAGHKVVATGRNPEKVTPIAWKRRESPRGKIGHP